MAATLSEAERGFVAALPAADRDRLLDLLGAVATGVRSPSLYHHVAGHEGLTRAIALRATRELGVDVLLAVVASLGLEGEDRVHAVRALRSAVHGFAAIEARGGFAIPVDPDVSFQRLVAALAAGLA